ncbi:MAG: AAA family ATPase [Thermoanaerobaculia bacterium]|nr:AAA family ATPase [Thermoanaerobaculia bacterium]
MAGRDATESLETAALRWRCDPEELDFETTEDLEDVPGVVGQERATAALEFGMEMEGSGFHVFALGPEETKKRAIVRRLLEKRAAEEPAPLDLCYVNDFQDRHRPRALRLPAGRGADLARAMRHFLEELRPSLKEAFESEQHQARVEAAKEEAGQPHKEAMEGLEKRAQERDMTVIRTPQGLGIAPARDGEVLSSDEVEELSDEKKEELQEAALELQEELQEILKEMPRRKRKARKLVREVARDTARKVVTQMLANVRRAFEEFDQVQTFLEEVVEDVVENTRQLTENDDGEQGSGQVVVQAPDGGGPTLPEEDPVLRRYRVNVLVDHSNTDRAPVVFEDHPTYQNLVGRIEYLPRMGSLVTDFNLIKAGALHRADGGYLILDARHVLMEILAWEGLKRALRSGEIRIETPREAMGLVSTVSLEPEPVPFTGKVILLGSRLLYDLLSDFDPDFGELIKVAADFDDRIDRSQESVRLYARLVATLAREADLRPFDRTAVARIIERSARLAGDTEKLTVRTRKLIDLLRESSHWAGKDGADTVSGDHVRRAIEEWEFRSSRARDRVHEAILRETILIDTEGRREGQVNGLSVLQLGEFAFGRPVRITARVRLGRGEVTDIEREVELGGPIHSKGVLILFGFLGQRFARERPLALAASLVFEQSYTGVEGDSASAAELVALLSAIAETPIRQDRALTGSINQHGQIQAVGGLNEKIEGFFAICRERGLTGDQGVIVPAANRKHLMLRQEVLDAVEAGEFHVWAVGTIDQAMELLTDLPMGEADEEGHYPEDSLNARVERRLAELADLWSELGDDTG